MQSVFLLTLTLIFNLFKDYFKINIYPIILTGLIAFNYDFIKHSDNILSDFPFLFFCFLTFNLMKNRINIINQILLGICLFFSYFIRDLGIFLLPTLFIFHLLHYKNYINNKYIIIFPYFGGENHINILLNDLSFKTVIINSKHYLRTLSRFFTTIHISGLLNSLVILIVIAISIIGAFTN